MKPLKETVYRQLLTIAVFIILIIAIFLGILLPKMLLPVYEKSIYEYLKQPLELIDYEINQNELKSEVAYLYKKDNGIIIASENLNQIIPLEAKQILKNVKDTYGKFKYHGNTYYYHTVYTTYVTKIAITNDSYIKNMRKDILYNLFPILFIVLILIVGLLVGWARRLVLKIEHLKEKIDNLDNDNYVDHYHYYTDDELKLLSDAIDQMKHTLKEQDEYKNMMYQNISHDFKTPLTVIKSYMEALEDHMVDTEEAYSVVKEQIGKLEAKVHSLLYLNKLNYIKDLKMQPEKRVDITPILNASLEKFKYHRPDIEWKVEIHDKTTSYRGSEDMWEAIIDNLLNNFIRYAKSLIRITIKNNRITFYNDGPNIDPNILDDIFTPYKKGIHGQFGLGLSIVKKTISLFGYEITVKNERKGVSFMIK